MRILLCALILGGLFTTGQAQTNPTQATDFVSATPQKLQVLPLGLMLSLPLQDSSAFYAYGDDHLWQGYIGSIPVKEEDFMRAAGRPDLAMDAKSYRDAKAGGIFIGALMLAAGAAVAVIGSQQEKTIARATSGNVTVEVSERDPDKALIGLGLVGAGIGALVLGSSANTSSKSRFTLQQACALPMLTTVN